MGPELHVTVYLLNVRPVTALRNLCMCIKFLSAGHFTSGAITKCSKTLKLGKIVTGSPF